MGVTVKVSITRGVLGSEHFFHPKSYSFMVPNIGIYTVEAQKLETS